jgi:excisionase family DNA binding protein
MSLAGHTEGAMTRRVVAPDAGLDHSASRRALDAGDAPGEVLTVPDVARYLKLPISTIYALVQEGQLPGRKIGRQWRFYKPLLDAWLRHPPDRAVQR